MEVDSEWLDKRKTYTVFLYGQVEKTDHVFEIKDEKSLGTQVSFIIVGNACQSLIDVSKIQHLSTYIIGVLCFYVLLPYA